MKKIAQCILFFTCVVSIAYSNDNRAGFETVPERNSLTIHSPSLRSRESTKIRLSNGLEAFLISDPETDQSAAAISIESGSWNDPEQYPGTAHFLEHMLFMGNKAYPEESEFFKYVYDHGGIVNAYTSTDRTVYTFSVNNDALTPALDRFSHFFIDPLFLPSGIGRELHAVDQENDKNIENDGWRGWMIFKETGNQNHPNAKFSTGNAKTLGTIPQEVLENWFETHYSSDNAHLVVYSSLPMDELIQLVNQDFLKIPQRQTTSNLTPIPLASSLQMGSITYIKPIKDLRSLSLTWELPKSFSYDNLSKTPELLAYVLNSKSQNNLYQNLKENELADTLHAGMQRLSKENLLFEINVDLTKHGAEHIDEVISKCFAAFNGFKNSGVPEYLFNEMQTMAKLNYEYQSRENAFQFVQNHAHHLMDEELETYPEKTIVPSVYSVKKMDQLLAFLTPKRCFFAVIAPPELTGVQPDKQERWLGGEYAIRDVPSNQLTAWNQASPDASNALPPQNPFIPQTIRISNKHAEPTRETPHPELIENSQIGKGYFWTDTEYLLPEISWILSIKSPQINGRAKNNVLLDLLIKSINNQLKPIASQASRAGLYPQISHGDLRFTIQVNGYSEKASQLLEEIFHTVKTIAPTKAQFQLYKESFLSKYENQDQKSLPVYQAIELTTNLLENDAPLSADLESELKNITYEEFISFIDKVFQQTYLEGMLTGNISENGAKKIWNRFKEHFASLNYPLGEQHTKEILILPQNQGPFMITDYTSMQGHAAILVIEEGAFSFEKSAAQDILGKALKTGFFETLRTKQQTAYMAHAWATEIEHELLQYFAVQSSTHQPQELIARFELFIEDFLKNFDENLPKERFEKMREMSIVTLSTPPTNLEVMTSRLHRLAFTYQGDFNRFDQLISALQALSYKELQLISKEFLSRRNTKRLVVLLEGASPSDKEFRYEQTTCENLKNLGTYVSWK